MPRHHSIGSWSAERGYYQEDIEFTAAEETARDAEETQALTDKAATETAATAKATSRQAGADKLVALGLTSDEVAALLQ